MSTLIAVIFRHDQDAAMSALHTLSKLESEHLLDLEDAVVVRRRQDGKIHVSQTVSLTGTGAWLGAVWGGLVNLLFTGSLGMRLVGNASTEFARLLGAHKDYGIDDRFIERLSVEVQPRCSALFILAREMTPDHVADILAGSGGEIIRTALSHDAEARLKHALAGALPDPVARHAAM